MAATALASDGKVLVAGGSTNNGTVTIERFTANGAKDNTWGSSGRVTINLGGAYARPTGMVAVGTTHVLVIAENPSGNRNVFTVAKVGTSGLDTTFGTSGIARVAFPSNRAATAYDLAVLPTGKILLAGKSQGSNVASADTSFARLNANGSIDSTFGSGGQITHSIATGNAEDYATALAPLADGRFLATGPAAGVGMVSRFAASGALDATFGTGGKVVGGLTAAGSTFGARRRHGRRGRPRAAHRDADSERHLELGHPAAEGERLSDRPRRHLRHRRPGRPHGLCQHRRRRSDRLHPRRRPHPRPRRLREHRADVADQAPRRRPVAARRSARSR